MQELVNFLQNLIDSRTVIEYQKAGARHGWCGRLKDFNLDTKRIFIKYDNGSEVSYGLNALKCEFIEVVYDTQAYLVPLKTAPNFQDSKPKATGEYLVVTSDGKLLSSEPTYDDALFFALEQVKSTTSFTSVNIYKHEATVQTKETEAIVKTNQ